MKTNDTSNKPDKLVSIKPGLVEEDLPEVKATREIKVGEFTFRSCVYSDGRRGIEKKGVDSLLEYLSSGGSIRPADAKIIDDFFQGFGWRR